MDSLVLYTMIATIIVRRRRKRRRRRTEYMCNLYRKRNIQGEMFLVDDLEEDPPKFHKYFRMNKMTFYKLLSKISHKIQHKRTHARPILPKQRLAFALRFLCAGGSIQSLAFSHRISESAGCDIVKETLRAIWEILQPTYLPTPTENHWKNIARRFWEKWQFPNCIGACDGKHVRIKCPSNTGTEHYNYKNFFSNVLLALVDADYKFAVVDIGGQGSLSDSGILSQSEFGQELLNETLPVPPSALLPGSEICVPHVIVGDSGFALKRNLLRPFSITTTCVKEKIFNYRLSRARRVSENAFGILVARFRIFFTTIEAPEMANDIIQAAVVLHNFIMTEDSSNLLTPDTEENGEFREGSWRAALENFEGLLDLSVNDEEFNDHREDASIIRHKFAEYFVSEEGSLPWQFRFATRTQAFENIDD